MHRNRYRCPVPGSGLLPVAGLQDELAALLGEDRSRSQDALAPQLAKNALADARVSTTKQDLDRQIVALEAAGIPPERIYVDKKSGATTNRPGLQAVIKYARDGDVIVVHTLDRLGRTVRDTLNLIHDLAARGVGIRNLADPIKVDSSSPADPMAQLAVVLLALFAQMERTYSLERAAGARAAATAKGRRIGRPSVVDAV